MIAETTSTEPIFILGIMPRSGTNFLWNLVCLHPECTRARAPITEDMFLEHSDHLVRFTRAVRGAWDPEWGVFEDDVEEKLQESLAKGLTDFLWIDRTRRLVTKAPSVKNIDRFFDFWPNARLLILVRDGRSVVQSCMTTFGWDFETTARRWASAADEIRDFEQRAESSQAAFRVIRYEDLLDDVETHMKEILRFLSLDLDVFDFDAARRLPVHGSSVYRGDERDRVHWEPVEKQPEFQFKERWRDWPASMILRFDWIAAEQLRHFGYETRARPRHLPHVMKHGALDIRWGIRAGARATMRRLRHALGPKLRPLRRRLGLLRDA